MSAKKIEISEALYRSMEEVLGLTEEELREDPDLDLLENKIVDSLSIVTILSYVETLVGFPISLKNMKPEDFSTINTLSAALSRQKP